MMDDTHVNHIAIKRIYQPVEQGDGVRVLVDRLWPRGVTKAAAHVELWLKAVAPSPGLREWFAHDPAHWDGFRQQYLVELQANGEPVQRLRDLVGKGPVTLLYAAHDEVHNHARVLVEFLQQGGYDHGKRVG